MNRNPTHDFTGSQRSRLCGMAVRLLGSQEAFRREARILKRLVERFGVEEVERMIVGARLLNWTSLKSLGSEEGLGRRWALTRYWQSENRKPDVLRSVAQVLKSKGFV